MVPDLVRDDIGLGEIARRPEPAAQVPEKAQVDVHLLVARAVEGPDRRLREAAGRLDRAGEQHELGKLVLLVAAAEDVAPSVLGIGEHHGDELAHLVGLSGRLAGPARLLPRLLPSLLRAAQLGQQQRGIHAEQQRQHVLALLTSPRFRELSPKQVAPTLADEGIYMVSEATMCRLLRFVTPNDRFFGRDAAILAARHLVYQRARRRHPERWTTETRDWSPASAVTLNPNQTSSP